MSTTIAAVAGTTGSGLGSARHVIYAQNSGNWWAFSFTSINVLSSWYSPDNVSWTASTTKTLGNLHLSEGRNLQVAYKLIGSLDVVAFTYEISVSGGNQVFEFRATIGGTTITYHTAESSIGSTAFLLTSPAYSSGGLEFDSSNKLHVANGALQDQDADWTKSTADPGTGEQATAPTWSAVTLIDNSQSNEVKSAYLVDLGATHMGLICDNATADSTFTGLQWFTYDGSAWNSDSGNTKASGGTFTAIDKNNWGAVAVSATDVHLVYRTSTGSFIHRRYNGTTWSAGQTIPTQTNLAGGGIALGSDGISVWLSIIDTDSPNTIRTIRWTSLAYNDIADAWDGTWTAAETSTATRAFIGCSRDVANQTLLIYWTEGSNLVATLISAISPPDPPGIINRDTISALGSGVSPATTLAITTSGTLPKAGVDKVVCIFWASFAATPTINSVVDNATFPNNLTASVNSIRANAQAIWLYWLDLPAGATLGATYVATVTFSAAPTEFDGVLISYSGLKQGGPVSTNNNSGATASATPGSVTNPLNSLYTLGVTDNSGNNPATLTVAAPFLRQVAQLNGVSQQCGCFADVINTTGAQNPTTTFESSFNWQAIIAVWQSNPTGMVMSNILPGQTWRNYFQRGVLHPPLLTISTSSGGPINNISNASDTLSATSETATRILSLPRTSPDTLGAISDTATRAAQGFLRSITDALAAMSDTATRALMSFIRTTSDSLAAMSDTATKTLNLPRSLSESLTGISDNALRILSLPRTAPESLGALSDTASRASLSFVRSAQDTLTSLTDTATRASQTFLRSISDNLSSLSDTATAIKLVLRTASDSLSAMSDTATRSAMSFTRTATDTLAAGSDLATRILSLPRTSPDTLTTISDTATRILTMTRTATDSFAALSDTASRAALAFIRTATDTLASMADTVTRAIQTFIRTASDAFGAISDTASAVKLTIRTAADTLASISDTATRTAMTYLRSPVDTLPSLSDTANRAAQTFLRSALDALASLGDIAINTGAIVPVFFSIIGRVRDGSLISRLRDGTFRIFSRDSSTHGTARDSTLKTTGRDSSSKNKTRG